jgi:hypothetical protein
VLQVRKARLKNISLADEAKRTVKVPKPDFLTFLIAFLIASP